MTTRRKRLLGAASIAPAVWLVVFLVGIVTLMATTSEGEEESPLFLPLLIGHAIAILLALAVTAYYVVWLVRRDDVPDERKTLWIVILLMGNVLALPIFWFLYVWQERSLAPATPPQTWQPPPPQAPQ